MKKDPKVDWSNYRESAMCVEDEKGMNRALDNPKSRWSYKVPICVRGLVGSDGRVCAYVGKKCGRCLRFSEYEETFVETKSK